jgi:hypothetical protein
MRQHSMRGRSELQSDNTKQLRNDRGDLARGMGFGLEWKASGGSRVECAWRRHSPALSSLTFSQPIHHNRQALTNTSTSEYSDVLETIYLVKALV